MENKRISTLEYLLPVFAGVVARVESLRGRMGASQSTQQVEGLSPDGDAPQFESLLAESFGGA